MTERTENSDNTDNADTKNINNENKNHQTHYNKGHVTNNETRANTNSNNITNNNKINTHHHSIHMYEHTYFPWFGDAKGVTTPVIWYCLFFNKRLALWLAKDHVGWMPPNHPPESPACAHCGDGGGWSVSASRGLFIFGWCILFLGVVNGHQNQDHRHPSDLSPGPRCSVCQKQVAVAGGIFCGRRRGDGSIKGGWGLWQWKIWWAMMKFQNWLEGIPRPKSWRLCCLGDNFC